MIRSLRHRGPDAAGTRSLDGCVLGHARLRIIDLSPAGDQPMANEERTVWVTFNGEIYNFRELRRELEGRGHHFRSETDTEVLVHLYEEHGEDLAGRLRGMFAFAIWDAREKRLLLCRDRLGIKPLYYRAEGGSFRFASEARALAGRGAGLDPAATASFLRLGWVAGPATIFSGVSELPPGHVLAWQEGRAELRPYWAPSGDTGEGPPALDELRDALRDSMERHLVADVPLGLFLSSGVDSAALAHLASLVGADIRAYTVSFDVGEDETDRAAGIASSLGIPHTGVPVRGEEVLGSLERIVGDMDQPTVDGVNSWVICRAVREVGLVVALSGLGGDELFQGYSTFQHVPRLARAARVLAPLPAWARRAPAAFAGIVPGGTHSRARRALEAVASGGWGPSYAAVRGLFSQGEIGRLWPPWRVVGTGDSAEPEANGQGGESAVAHLEIANYLPFQLLRDTDAMSMAHAVEVRVPLLDDEVVRVALRCQGGIDGLRGKRLLAAAVDPRLSPLAERPKRTFTLPFDSWLRGPLRDRTAAALDRLTEEDAGFDRTAVDGMWRAFEAGRAGWRPVWALAVLGMWLDVR